MDFPAWFEEMIWNPQNLYSLRVSRCFVRLAQAKERYWANSIFQTRCAAFWLNVCLRMDDVSIATWTRLFDRWPDLRLKGPMRRTCIYPLGLGSEVEGMDRTRRTRQHTISLLTLLALLIAVPPDRIDITFDIVDDYEVVDEWVGRHQLRMYATTVTGKEILGRMYRNVRETSSFH
jgi:hypothetical protein